MGMCTGRHREWTDILSLGYRIVGIKSGKIRDRVGKVNRHSLKEYL